MKLERALVVRRGEAASFELLPEPIELLRFNHERSAIPDVHGLIPTLARIVPHEGAMRDTEDYCIELTDRAMSRRLLKFAAAQ